MRSERDIWIRIAGNAKMIREGGLWHWRCYVRLEGPEIPLKGFRLAGGEASERNLRPGTDPAAANPLGLAAWIDFYGDLTVTDGIAEIRLKNPA